MRCFARRAISYPLSALVLLPFLLVSCLGLAQIRNIPTQMELTISKSEIVTGDTALITVTLKNPEDKIVAARHDMSVTLHRESLLPGGAAEDQKLVIAGGQQSITRELKFTTPGPVRLLARAKNLPKATAVLAVKEAAASPKPVAKVFLHVPPVIHPRKGTWIAKVFLVAVDDAGNPQSVSADLPVNLYASRGAVDPERVVIRKGYARSSEEIQLLSLHPGSAWIAAEPEGMPRATQEVEYQEPEPSKIRVIVQPTEGLGQSGNSITSNPTAFVEVILQDEMGNTTPSHAESMEVMVSSTHGQLRPRVLSIAKGKCHSSEAQLTSFGAGDAIITATAQNVADGTHTVTFEFPWLLLLAATLGGLLGALIRDLNHKCLSLGVCGKNLVIGLVMGVVVYGFSLFGALESAARWFDIVDINAIPTSNHFGAGLLGFLGGYLGRRLLKHGSVVSLERTKSVHPAGAGT